MPLTTRVANESASNFAVGSEIASAVQTFGKQSLDPAAQLLVSLARLGQQYIALRGGRSRGITI